MGFPPPDLPLEAMAKWGGRGLGGGGRPLVVWSAMLRNSVYVTHEPKTAFAKHLRKRMTPGEVKLWSKLRMKRFHGLKFRRQVPIGPFIVDFLCAEKQLIIEVDGDAHFEPGAKEKDLRREEYLKAQGFAVLRFLNSEIVCDLDSAIEVLERELGFTSL